MSNLTPEQWTKIILAAIGFFVALITAIFAVNKRIHKVRNIGSNSVVINGDGNINKDK
ncbi:hypothetical protein OHW83_10550 [Acinetobacter baumannii]|uniref:hypothetical protein n=1 Tax=Acinetobacter baumannii TaxID=470 RepID=UPI00044AA94B|nr:hypothetical protein [Acinetobacter baumannii]EHU2486192.1 hypothetical protein [Acinetobacter baumannii]EXC12437.1 hypothetical protein J533_3002 [Acinetobacter baumannii 4749]MCY2773810.1 hypothetical protein [Acinetobacter baumannii]MCY2775225.1 hypothetical protein [Acinetobacter baumannii]MCY2798162.1 hypothetical protein [Acinetobacter baumannii]